ncbi:SDR family oxidoreductase [Sphingomonas canadensis]|uniref:SDR family oxidoreductase n=1 Tax=Sphingomonas canadensis TaxID=1219257 RepID=A0ABW3HGF9_9SPHN|nr:SDR family oxidoreductase [Sphingomonas canadensis]MCW3838092.1 SDR family oxidoreductase [Sphingomonas canadensis]
MDDRRQSVLVTAGGSGIGRAIAERFLRAGAEVHVCDVDADALAALEAEEPMVRSYRADVSDEREVAAMFDAIGGVDVLVNNAGIGGPRGSIEEIDGVEWERTIAVNLTGAFHVTRRAVAAMKTAGGGAIVNISTASVRTGMPMRTAYVASKQGLMGFTANLARELGPDNIRCNAILPGLIDNPRGRALVARMADENGRSVAETEAEMLRFISMRCWIDPAEVGDLAVFLASPAARHITGQFIGVCGGAEWEG